MLETSKGCDLRLTLDVEQNRRKHLLTIKVARIGLGGQVVRFVPYLSQ